MTTSDTSKGTAFENWVMIEPVVISPRCQGDGGPVRLSIPYVPGKPENRGGVRKMLRDREYVAPNQPGKNGDIHWMRSQFFVDPADRAAESIPIEQYKFSDLIHAGSFMCDGQAVGGWACRDGQKVYGCALYMAFAAIGVRHDSMESVPALMDAIGYDPTRLFVGYPHITTKYSPVDANGAYASAGPRVYGNVTAVIQHLNDDYAWSIPSIVEWLRQLGV